MPSISFGHYATDYDLKESDGKWFVNDSEQLYRFQFGN
jgi:hypothetical protein